MITNYSRRISSASENTLILQLTRLSRA